MGALLKYIVPALSQIVPLVLKEVERRRLQQDENVKLELAIVRRKKDRRGKPIAEIIEENRA